MSDDRFLSEYKLAVDKLGVRDDGSNVLDVGCGIFRLGKLLGNLGYSNTNYVGVDINYKRNPEMKKTAIEFKGRGSLICGLAQRLPFGEDTFEYVMCLGMPNYEKVPEYGEEFGKKTMQIIASELMRMTTPNGKVFIHPENGFLLPLLELGMNQIDSGEYNENQYFLFQK